MSNGTGKKAASKPAMKKVQEGPAQKEVFVFTPEGFQEVNNFLALAGESEKQGILDYKAAFHTLVAKVRGSIKPM
jgi:hypothetical protein